MRPVTRDDLPALAALAQRTWADAFGSSVAPEEEAAELEATRSETYFREALRRDAILVAEHDGALVGYVQFGDVDIAEADAAPADRALKRVYVETELQGQGIGSALVDAALAHPLLAAAPRVFLQVWEENARALRLYEHRGFRVAGRTRFRIGGGEVVEDLVLVRERAPLPGRSLD